MIALKKYKCKRLVLFDIATELCIITQKSLEFVGFYLKT